LGIAAAADNVRSLLVVDDTSAFRIIDTLGSIPIAIISCGGLLSFDSK
jgi:hypothetical protein